MPDLESQMPDLWHSATNLKERIIGINLTVNERIATMNEAFGNPAPTYPQFDIERVRKQCLNIFDEYCELLKALGINDGELLLLKSRHKDVMRQSQEELWSNPVNVLDLRDALCDIQVFASGAQHFLGVDADEDMNAVIDGVMTRFIKDEADKEATIAKHAAKGVTDVYFEGEYPTMVMKSASDQPDAPKGKFLKSASFKEPTFPLPFLYNTLRNVNVPEATARQLADAGLGFDVKLDDNGSISRISVDIGAGILHITCAPENIEARGELS